MAAPRPERLRGQGVARPPQAELAFDALASLVSSVTRVGPKFQESEMVALSQSEMVPFSLSSRF